MYDAIFLDCDGVVTDKRARVDEKVIFEVYRLTHAGKRIAFVTGRPLAWLSRNIIPVLERFHPSPAEKARLFFVGECGNRWLFFSGNSFLHGADDTNSVPEAIRARIRRESARFPLLSFDETKESFVSLEIRHGAIVSPDVEREANQQLDDACEYFSVRYPGLSVMRTLYAVDVLPRGIGKASGARRALELMGSVREALVIGDSAADIQMGEELARRGIRFRFYYVGEQQTPPVAFEVRKPSRCYAEGTLEVLSEVR